MADGAGIRISSVIHCHTENVLLFVHVQYKQTGTVCGIVSLKLGEIENKT